MSVARIAEGMLLKMINDEKRREVAQKLRGLPIDMYSTIDEWEKDGLFINNSVSDEGDYSQIHDAVFGYFPAEYMHPGDYEELHERLADLIDRPTCHDATDNFCEFVCSKCGCSLDISNDFEPTLWVDGKATVPSYCPNCGAEVLDD